MLGALCYPIAVLGGEIVLPELTEHLHGRKAKDGGSKNSAWAACHALTRVPGTASLQLLREATADDMRLVRRVAMTSLAARAGPGDDESAAIFRTAMTKAVDHEVRVRCTFLR